MPDPHELRQRIQEVYMRLCRQEKPHGALSWFARQAHVDPYSVTRWVQGEREPSGPTIGLLEALEREAGIE